MIVQNLFFLDKSMIHSPKQLHKNVQPKLNNFNLKILVDKSTAHVKMVKIMVRRNKEEEEKIIVQTSKYKI